MMAETSKKLEDNAEPNPSDTRDRGRLHAVADQALGAARQVGEKSAEVVKRAAETAADATRHTAELATRAGEKVVGAVKGTGETAADAAQETTRSAVNVADQASTVTISGWLTAAGLQGPLTDAGFERSQRALEAGSQVIEVYRQATERAAGDVRALFDSWTSLGRGVQRWQQTYLDTVRHSLATVGGKHRDLIQSNSPVKLAEVQRDLYVDLVNASLRSTVNLLQLAGQIVQESVRPLQERAQARG